MEDVVAIRVSDRKKGKGYFLTWGRVFDRIDPTSLLEAVRTELVKRGFDEIECLNVCMSLAEASKEFYFFEGMLRFGWNPPPYGRRYEAWRVKTRRRVLRGEDIIMVTPMDAMYLRETKTNVFKTGRRARKRRGEMFKAT